MHKNGLKVTVFGTWYMDSRPIFYINLYGMGGKLHKIIYIIKIIKFT